MYRIEQPEQAGLYLRRVREGIGMSRQDLSDTAHISQRTIFSLETGRATGVRLDKLMSVADVLGVDIYADCRSMRHDEDGE